MMHSIFFWTVCLLWLTSIISAYYSKNNFPYVRNEVGSYSRFTPLALISEEAEPISNLTPLTFNVSRNSILEVRNIGYAVRSSPIKKMSLTVTGGILFNDIYDLYIATHHNNGDVRGRQAAATENTEGTALGHQLLFYKVRYGSVENALRHPDGTVVVVFQVILGRPRDNSMFEAYRSVLYKVKQLNSTSTISTGDALSWLLNPITREKCFYYGYPGSALDIFTGRETPAAILIQIPIYNSASISDHQFEAYTQVLNQNNQPTANILPTYPRGGRPLIRVFSQNPVIVNYRK